MDQYDEKAYPIKESVMKEIYGMLSDIINCQVKYQNDHLAMAQQVIAANVLEALTIKSVLNEVTQWQE